MRKLILPRRRLLTRRQAVIGLLCAPAVARAGSLSLLGAGKPPGGAAAATFLGAIARGTDAYDQNFTFTAVPLSASGLNVAAVGASTLNTGEWNTCTIDGVAATKIATLTNSGGNQRIAVFAAASSGNTSGDVVFNVATFGAYDPVMDMWGVVGAASATPSVTASVQGLNATTTLAIPANGAAIGFAYGTNASAETLVGMTTDDTRTGGTDVNYGTGGHTNTPGSTTVGTSTVGGTNLAAIFVAWGP